MCDVKGLVGAFNQEKTRVGAFSVVVNFCYSSSAVKNLLHLSNFGVSAGCWLAWWAGAWAAGSKTCPGCTSRWSSSSPGYRNMHTERASSFVFCLNLVITKWNKDPVLSLKWLRTQDDSKQSLKVDDRKLSSVCVFVTAKQNLFSD